MSNLANQQINSTYPGILQIPGGVTSALQPVQDGLGVNTGLLVSKTATSAITADHFTASKDGVLIPNAVPRLITDGFGDILNARDFGATGDGVTDDTSAIQNAINSATVGTTIYLPAGTYLLTATLTISSPGIRLIGAGGAGQHNVTQTYGAILKANHQSGPVIRTENIGIEIGDLIISASSTRTSGSQGTNYGIWVEALDNPTASTARTYIHNIRITGQPNHGLVVVGNCGGSVLFMVDVDTCWGHGIVFSAGNLTSRANKTRPGIVDIITCRSTRNGGYAIMLGDAGTSAFDTPYRFQIVDFESFYCAINTGITLNNYSAYIYGENHLIQSSAFSGANVANTDSITGGLYFAGRYSTISNCRFIDCLLYAIYVDNRAFHTTEDVMIERFYIINQYKPADYYNPAIWINPACKSVTVDINTTNPSVGLNVCSQTSTYLEFKSRGLRSYSGTEQAFSYSSTLGAISLAADKAGYFEFTLVCYGVIMISGNTATSKPSLASFRFGDGSAYVAILGGAGTGATGALTGTTGTAGNFTISASTTDNRLYIENRTAGARGYSVTFLSLVGLSASGELPNLSGYTAV